MGGKKENTKLAKIIEERRLKKEAEKKKKEDEKNAASNQKEVEDVVDKPHQDEPSNDAGSPEPKSAADHPGGDSSDSDVDDDNQMLDLKNKIVEKQLNAQDQKDIIKADWITNKNDSVEPKSSTEKPKEKKDASNISFGGGRPMKFTRKKPTGGFAGDDFESLADIDKNDDGKQKKDKNKNKNASAADGGKPFEHMGSTAVDKNKKHEEEKETAAPQRPRFFGKAKIGGGGAEA